MGLILDVAVIALTLVVIGSLALLAWTLAVSAVRATGRSMAQMVTTRKAVADAEARVNRASSRASATLLELRRKTTPGDAPDA